MQTYQIPEFCGVTMCSSFSVPHSMSLFIWHRMKLGELGSLGAEKWTTFGGAISPINKTKLRPPLFRAPTDPTESYTAALGDMAGMQLDLSDIYFGIQLHPPKDFCNFSCSFWMIKSNRYWSRSVQEKNISTNMFDTFQYQT